MHRSTDDRGPPRRDHRQEVTNKVIELIESGTAPWMKPWKADSTLRLPRNPTTGLAYRGGNVIALLVAGMQHGYSDPRWLTFKQAKDAGWHVRKGEHHSAVIEYWGSAPQKPKPGEEVIEDPDKPGFYRFPKYYQLFNAEQIEGIPPLELKKHEPWEVIESGEAILKNSGADIRHGGAQAFYSKRDDRIQMPDRNAFPGASEYLGTAFHELAHWSGAPHRLNRKSLVESKAFGDEAYAFDELVSDMTSAFIAAEKGIPYSPEQTAAYVASWLKALKNDKNAIFKAAHDASAATDFILGMEKGKEQQSPAGEAGPSHAERVVAERRGGHEAGHHR